MIGWELANAPGLLAAWYPPAMDYADEEEECPTPFDLAWLLTCVKHFGLPIVDTDSMDTIFHIIARMRMPYTPHQSRVLSDPTSLLVHSLHELVLFGRNAGLSFMTVNGSGVTPIQLLPAKPSEAGEADGAKPAKRAVNQFCVLQVLIREDLLTQDEKAQLNL
jgi:hypothetical protein